MRYIFFGSPDFAAIILKKMIEAGMPPAAVVCNPDRPTGRKKILTPPPVKTKIMNYESEIKDRIKILQPEKLDEKFLDSLFLLHDSFDVFIVAAYAKILPKEIIHLPRLGTIGVHPSLLPQYRGATPIQSAILNEEQVTGTTLFLIDEKVDHGPILAKSEIRISKSETYESLHNKLAELSADLLIATLPKFVRGEITPKPQDETKATYTKKFTAENAYVEPEILRHAQDGAHPEEAGVLDRRIRALNPEPGVWTKIDGVRTKLLDAEIKNGHLQLHIIQKEGKKPQAL